MATVSFDLSDFSSFTINGVSPYDTSGYSVSNAGDINGDGVDDAIIGAPVFNGNNPNAPNTPGNAYVVFGNKNGFSDELDLSALDGTNGFAIEGITAGDLTGRSVSGAGDVNLALTSVNSMALTALLSTVLMLLTSQVSVSALPTSTAMDSLT